MKILYLCISIMLFTNPSAFAQSYYQQASDYLADELFGLYELLDLENTLQKRDILEHQRRRYLNEIPWTAIVGEIFTIPDFEEEELFIFNPQNLQEKSFNSGSRCKLKLGGSIEILEISNTYETALVKYHSPHLVPGLGCPNQIMGGIHYHVLKQLFQRRISFIENIMFIKSIDSHELKNEGLMAHVRQEILLSGFHPKKIKNLNWPSERPTYKLKERCLLIPEMELKIVAGFSNNKKVLIQYVGSDATNCQPYTFFVLAY